MCVCVCVCVCACVCVCVCASTCVHAYVYVCVCVGGGGGGGMYKCVSVCVSVSVCAHKLQQYIYAHKSVLSLLAACHSTQRLQTPSPTAQCPESALTTGICAEGKLPGTQWKETHVSHLNSLFHSTRLQADSLCL